MKRVLTTALACASTTVLAQSSVSIFGVIDTALTHGRGSISKLTSVSSNATAATLLGFRGQEDLGGGLKAGFWLEAGFNSDTGTGVATNTNNQPSGASAPTGGLQGLTFGRRSTVSVGGDWGELRLGRDVTPSYWTISDFDPFSNLGVGNSMVVVVPAAQGGPTQSRASNSIAYLAGQRFNEYSRLSPVAGFNFTALYHLGENASDSANKNDGNGYSVKLAYTGPQYNLAIGLARAQFATGDAWQRNIAGSYTIGPARLMAIVASDKFGVVDGRGFLVGTTVAVSTGFVKVAYSSYRLDNATHATTSKVSLGYLHSLSKRTQLFTTVARVSNEGGATLALGRSVTAPNQHSSGIDVGVRHFF